MNDPRVHELTRETALRLSLDGKLVAFVLSDKPAGFEYRCAPASAGWTCHLPADVQQAYPLWSCNANQTLLLQSHNRQWFGKTYHDAAGLDHIADTHQGLFADLFITVYEDEATDEELATAAKTCGFQFLKESIDFAVAHGADAENWTRLKSDFIQEIDRKSRLDAH